MNSISEQRDEDVIDLGAARDQTKGGVAPNRDLQGGIGLGGITNE